MKLARRHLKRALRSGPVKLARYGALALRQRLCDAIHRRQATHTPTYSSGSASFHSILGPLDRQAVGASASIPAEVINHWQAHSFDLLGSGWVRSLGRGDNPEDSNTEASDELLGRLPDEYMRIDWHCDLRSGHRWDPATWWREIRIPTGSGADIKFPWELSRCQHLPALALAAVGQADLRLASEVWNQIIDFTGANPPRFGVNWRCPMDVAIRAANWVVAVSILDSGGIDRPDGFDDLLARSLRDHGRHVRLHLEWFPDRTGNHYLANVCGLAFIAAGLGPHDEEGGKWLGLAARELAREVQDQFLPDGGHFEGSVAYHRLCLEMAVWATALCHGCGFGFPGEHFDRLALATELLAACVKPSGDFVQIGDNDSGRFLNLCPVFDEDFRERQLDPSATLAAAGSLFGWKVEGADGLLISALCEPVETERPEPYIAIGDGMPDIGDQKSLTLEYGPGLSEGLESLVFPHFGLFILRGQRLWLSVRCGGEQDPIGAHRHNDQLAVELTVDNRDIVRDPGTFCYTPDPQLRNAYRSVDAHFVPRIAWGQEPASLDSGLFYLDPAMNGQCIRFDATGFAGCHSGFGTTVWRFVSIGEDRIVISDFIDGEGDIMPPTMPTETRLSFSPGYGRTD